MDPTTPEPQQALLLLDPATDDPIPEDELVARLPPAERRVILRLSEFGARPTTRAPSRCRDLCPAVDAMLARARAASDDRTATHYYVAGRASLPLFTYLGLRHGPHGALTTVDRRHDGGWDLVPTHSHDRRTAPFFRAPEVVPGRQPDGPVAVVLSTGDPAPHEAIADYLGRHREGHAATVVLATERSDARSLHAADVAAAVAEVGELFRDLRRHATRARGLALFIAGPAPLAVIAGRSLDPNLYRPIWVPTFDAGAYHDAIRWPRGAVHGGELRVLVFAPPVRDGEPDVPAALHDGLARGARLRIEVVRGATIDAVAPVIGAFAPHVLHVAAPGSDGDLVAAVEAAGDQLQLLALNTCGSAAATELLHDHVDCAIGIRKPLADASALQFTAAFYQALSHGRSIAQAHDQGLAALHLRQLPRGDEFELLVRPGCDASEWVPLPSATA